MKKNFEDGMIAQVGPTAPLFCSQLTQMTFAELDEVTDKNHYLARRSLYQGTRFWLREDFTEYQLVAWLTWYYKNNPSVIRLAL